MITLGSKVRDKVTGLEGIVVARGEYLNGCVRCGVQARMDKDGKVPDSYWIDEHQLEMLEAGASLSERTTGGPAEKMTRKNS